MFNPLPVFHAFGLTGGLLLGLMTGMKVYLYPTPLHYRQIPELVYGVNATALLRRRHVSRRLCENGQPLRFPQPALCRVRRRAGEGGNAPHLHGKIRPAHFRGLWRDGDLAGARRQHADVQPQRHGRAPDARHGAPARANTRHRPGRAPVCARPQRDGRLLSRRQSRRIRAAAQGWHDTGDIVDIDADGFVTIFGRAKRFAKIGGEIVSLAAVEALTSGLWPDDPPCVVAAPDPKKGERLIMATTKTGATRAEVQAWLKIKGASELMAPAQVVVLDEIPLLGSGKTDYVKLAEVLRKAVA